MPRLVDISMCLEIDVPSDPPLARPKLTYLDHGQTIDRIRSFFPGLRRDELPDGAGWAIEKVEITTHNGTHMDAPYHFHPAMDHALGPPKRSMTVDEMPLELLPATGFQVACFPVKIRSGSAGWTRAVAILDN